MNMSELKAWLDAEIKRLEKERGIFHDWQIRNLRINELKRVREVVGD